MTIHSPADIAIFNPDDLLFFIDETGDETFRDPRNPIFGLGGVAVLGSELAPLIEQPWQIVRRSLGQKANTPLHANRFERRLSNKKESLIIEYFENNPVRRFALIARNDTTFVGPQIDDPIIASMSNVLLKRIESIAKWTHARCIQVIFEENARLVPKLEKFIGNTRFEENGDVLPLNCYVMKKGCNPGLEVADFLIHTVAGHIRSGRDTNGKFARRFDAIFKSVSPQLVSFIEIKGIKWEDGSTLPE